MATFSAFLSSLRGRQAGTKEILKHLRPHVRTEPTAGPVVTPIGAGASPPAASTCQQPAPLLGVSAPRNVEALCDSAREIYDLHSGVSGAADTFLKNRKGGYDGRSSMSVYFDLVGALPKASAKFLFFAKNNLIEVFGHDVGAVLFSEIEQHPRVAHGQIVQLFAAKKSAILALLDAEATLDVSPTPPPSTPPPGSVRTCERNVDAAHSKKPDTSGLRALARAEGALLWAETQDLSKSITDREAASSRLSNLLKEQRIRAT